MVFVLPRYVLGDDPGYRTGLALVDLLSDECESWEIQFDDAGPFLEELIARYRPAIGCEAFIINVNTATNSQAPWSLEGIGIVRFLAKKYGCPFKIQSQSSAVSFAPDPLLKRLGWYKPNRNIKRAQQQAVKLLVDHGWWHSALDPEDHRVAQ